MKTTLKTIFIMLAVVMLSTTLYGLVHTDSLALSPNGNFWISAGSIVEILMVNGNNCLVLYGGQTGVIPCDNMYFMGRWGRGTINRSPSPRLQ